jgi:UDP-galactopyranose mutase
LQKGGDGFVKYDYLIVGAGLFGSVFANKATTHGKKCLVIDKRSHIGGNVFTEQAEQINVHKYGAHIFHTNDSEVWDYINQFAEFNRYTNSPIANFKGEIYSLPFNMNTFYKLWGCITPSEAENIINEQRLNAAEPQNLEEQALSLVGRDIYEKLIKGYTEKQWGRDCKDLPAFIIKRLPVRFTWDNNYFNDRFQGIPIGGYTKIVEKMLKGCEVRLNTCYNAKYLNVAEKIVYTGMLDEFYGFKFGRLEYRTLRFESEILDNISFQGNAVINYTDRETPYTRIIEHKHFEFGTQPKTIITREYPKEFEQGDEPYYPVNDDKNNRLYSRYRELAGKEKNVIFGGRLADYKYYDMWQVIRNALDISRNDLSE